MTTKKLDAAEALRRLAEIRKGIPFLEESTQRRTSDGRLEDCRTAEEFEALALAEGLQNLADDLSATTSQLQWIVDGYTLVVAGHLLPAGRRGARFGRRTARSAGLVIFAAGSIASGGAPSASRLSRTRAGRGRGGAGFRQCAQRVGAAGTWHIERLGGDLEQSLPRGRAQRGQALDGVERVAGLALTGRVEQRGHAGVVEVPSESRDLPETERGGGRERRAQLEPAAQRFFGFVAGAATERKSDAAQRALTIRVSVFGGETGGSQREAPDRFRLVSAGCAGCGAAFRPPKGTSPPLLIAR
jgi:hypothetical protein